MKLGSTNYNSTVIMFMSQKHDDHFGPKSEYCQSKELYKVASDQEESPDVEQK
jgi:hypothetical protein